MLGFNRDLMVKLASGFDVWVEFRKASADYHALLAKTSAKAFEQVMKEMVAISERGEKIESVRTLMNLWMDTIDQAFTKLYKTEEYLNVQRNMSNAVMKYRMKEQEIVEVMMKMFNLPTRSELDDAYRSLYELRREVRAMKKALKERDGVAPVVVAAAAEEPKKVAAKAPRKPANGKKAPKEAAPEPVADGQ
jgi:class III poly(R)-hydroxyalkanoic acid synthase PhaE subunit